jgi:hypothetical protein
MTTVKVDIDRGEAVRVAPIAFEAIAGSWRRSLIPAAIGMAIGLLIAPTLGAMILFLAFLPLGSEAAIASKGHHESVYITLEIAGALIGWKMGERWYWKRHIDRFVRGLEERGTPAKVETAFSIEQEGFRTVSVRGTTIASWPSIIEVWCIPTHWLIQTDSFTFALPRRAFPTEEQERHFVAKLAACLSDQARRRSAPALSIIEGNQTA